jgi:hypothetical protein
MTGEERTDAETLIDLYGTVWTLFRDRPFDAETLGRRFVERGDHEAVVGSDEPSVSLARLVEAGVLESTPEGYRVVVEPNAAADALAADESLSTEAARQRVLSSLTASAADESGTLVREGERYAVVELGVDESVEAAADRVVAAADADHRGVVVATPGTNADSAQRLADRLIETRSWTKAGSTVVEGDDAGEELVFRLYLERRGRER